MSGDRPSRDCVHGRHRRGPAVQRREFDLKRLPARVQAQYLRRIRLPAAADLPAGLATAIRSAFRERAFGRLDELALDAYSLEDLPDFDFVDTRE